MSRSSLRPYITELSAAWAGYAPFAARLAEAAAIITFILYVGDLYQPRQAIGPRELVARVLICQGAAAMVVAALGFAVPGLRVGRSAFLETFLLTTIGLTAWGERSSWPRGRSIR